MEGISHTTYPFLTILPQRAMKVKVAQSCPTLCDPIDCIVHGILQARILEWVAFSRGSFQPRVWTQVSHITGRYFYQLSHRGSPRILEWVAYLFSRRSSSPRNGTGVSCVAGRFFSNWAIRKAHISSVQFSCSVVSDFLRSHELQHTRPPCPSPTPGVHSNSCPLSRWCHPAISSSVSPFSSCPQYLPASESFPMSQHFAWGGQSTGVSALALFLQKNTQEGSPLEWTGWISLQSKGLSRVFSNTTVQSINSLVLSLLHSPTLTSIHDHRKNHSLD